MDRVRVLSGDRRGVSAPRLPVYALSGLLAAFLYDVVGPGVAVDRYVVHGMASWMPARARGSGPVLLMVSTADVDRWGPLPWESDLWARALQALHDAGATTAWVVDPSPRLSVTADVWARPPVLGAVVSAGSGPPDPWLGVVTEAQPACANGACGPVGGWVFPRAVDLARLSVSDLLDAPPGALDLTGSAALVGIEAADWRRGDGAPPAERIAVVLAAVRAGDVASPLGPGGRAGWLLMSFLVAWTAAAAKPRPGRWALASVASLAAAALAWVTLGWAVPLVAAAGAAAAPSWGGRLAEVQALQAQARRLSLLVLRLASRAGTLRRRITDADALFEQLDEATRALVPAAPVALFLDQGGHPKLHASSVPDGWDFVWASVSVRSPDFAAAREVPDGIVSFGAQHAGQSIRIVALSGTTGRIGWWAIGGGPVVVDERRMGRLARWLSERTDLSQGASGVAGAGASQPTLDPAATEALFLAADEERRRWQTAVVAVGLPAMVLDVTGGVVLLNPAFDREFEAEALPRVRSFQELVAALELEDRLGEWTRRLFVDQEPIVVPWSMRLALHLRPIALGASGGGGEEPLLGYIGWLQPAVDATAP